MFSQKNSILRKAIAKCTGAESKIMVFIDSGLVKAQPKLIGKVKRYLKILPVIIPGGECTKTARNTEKIIAHLMNNNMCRHSCVIAIGGGSVLDTVGYASTIYHRGLKLIRVPTTVLSQNDAGIGVKNAINHAGSKNMLGTFAAPSAVINDVSFLTTLSTDDWTGGISEAFKIASIKDRQFFIWLCKNADRLAKRDLSVMESLINKCAILHLDHIRKASDPFETGSARPLDYGHWSAHGLEVLSKGRISHGHAVSIGIALDSCYAMIQGFISKEDLARLLKGLTACGLPIWDRLLENKATLSYLTSNALEAFRIHMGGRLTIAMPCPIGKTTEIGSIDINALHESLALLCFLAVTSKKK